MTQNPYMMVWTTVLHKFFLYRWDRFGVGQGGGGLEFGLGFAKNHIFVHITPLIHVFLYLFISYIQ